MCNFIKLKSFFIIIIITSIIQSKMQQINYELTAKLSVQTRLIEKLNGDITTLKSIVETQSVDIQRIQSVVSQLIAGLFNAETQPDLVVLHNNVLSGGDTTGEIILQELYPTTRQGDRLETRIKTVELIVSELLTQTTRANTLLSMDMPKSQTHYYSEIDDDWPNHLPTYDREDPEEEEDADQEDPEEEEVTECIDGAWPDDPKYSSRLISTTRIFNSFDICGND